MTEKTIHQTFLREIFASKEKLEDEIGMLESKIDTINRVIEARWKSLIGFGCGYFDNWTLNDLDVVAVKYNSRSGEGTDYIPIRFFVGTLEDAKIAYKEYLDEIKEERKKRKAGLEEKKERELLKNLSEKYKE